MRKCASCSGESLALLRIRSKGKGEIKITLAREQRNPFTILSIPERATQDSLESFFGRYKDWV
jgi:hypothetical protein